MAPDEPLKQVGIYEDCMPRELFCGERKVLKSGNLSTQKKAPQSGGTNHFILIEPFPQSFQYRPAAEPFF